MARLSAPRGTTDILPAEARRWAGLESAMREVFARYGYGEIRTPIFEHTELFARGIGEDTDVVEKEMYSFEDRGERSLTLRPEGTAGAVRAYLERRLDTEPQPVKLWYAGPMFRYERPQAGRARQFHQLGAECIGTEDPAADVEVIAMVAALFRRLGLTKYELHLNSIGCPECRPAYVRKLRAALEPVRGSLCKSCQDRFERNTLRVLDCKRESCRELTKNAPVILDSLCRDCDGHFAQVRRYLDELAIPYVINTRLVRGLDYYTRTVFEFLSPHLGAQDALGGGGRYDGLVETLGGPPTPAVGFAAGMERILLATEGLDQPETASVDAYVATLGDAGRRVGVVLAERLRRVGLRVELDYMERSLRAQMRQANRLGAKSVLIIGDDEAAAGTVQLRDMESGAERTVGIDEVEHALDEKRGGE